MSFIKSLRVKVLLSALVPFTLVMVVVALIALYAYERVARDVVEQRDAELAKITAARLSEGLSLQSQILNNLAADDDVQSMEPARLRRALEGVQDQLFVFDAGVVVYDREGVAVWSDLFAFERREKSFPIPSEFEKVRNSSRAHFSDVFMDTHSGEHAVLLGVPVVASGGEFMGVLVGVATLRSLVSDTTYSSVLEIAAGREGFAYLVDGKGRVIYHPDDSQLAGDQSSVAPVTRAIRGEAGAVIAENPAGATVISGFAPVPGTDWGVITEERWSSVVGPIRRNSKLLLGLILGGGVVSGALVLFTIGRVLKPVGELNLGAQRIAGGDFDHAIAVRTGDEIQDLAEQFNTMAGALKESYAELEQRVAVRTEELRESNQALRALIEASPLPILALDLGGEVRMWNLAAQDTFGWTQQEVIGRPLPLVPADEEETHRADFERALRGEALAGLEARRLKKDGSPIDISIWTAPLRDNQGDISGVVGVLADLTERKRAEEALRESETMLRQSEKMAVLGMLTAGVAHELNNPAAAVTSGATQLEGAIVGFGQAKSQLSQLDLTAAQQSEIQRLTQEALQWAARPPELNALARSDLEGELETWLVERGMPDAWILAPTLVNLSYDTAGLTELAESFAPDQLQAVIEGLDATYSVYNLLTEIGQSAGRISEIVKALKSYSYLDKDPMQEVDLHEGLNNTLLVLSHKLKSGITVRQEYAPHLPNIQANGSELNQVWTNLIDNAADALEQQGEITIRTRHEGERVVIEIEDDGPGIPVEIQPRIFEPFFTTKPPGQGTGLGLDISYNIVVHKHRGEIKVFSEPGKTCFQVWLPVTTPPTQAR